ncbi:hypothetical protein EVA_15672 [gut metagenome]|uniref:Uncharacterized protein n=1 Tax=gut metagenome TaxID=749906 RepID=J9C8K5_9ZZZZ
MPSSRHIASKIEIRFIYSNFSLKIQICCLHYTSSTKRMEDFCPRQVMFAKRVPENEIMPRFAALPQWILYTIFSTFYCLINTGHLTEAFFAYLRFSRRVFRLFRIRER